MPRIDFQQLLDQASQTLKPRRINSHTDRGYSYFFSTTERNVS